MFGTILKATKSSFQKGMTFCRSIYVKKVMKLLVYIFEQPSYLCKNMFFVVPVTFSNMFNLNINVFFGIYSFDLIRILLNKLCKYMLFHYFLFLFISLV